jgi:radical SAM superfamily enzyme YgiQ (UPF0313 family)
MKLLLISPENPLCKTKKAVRPGPLGLAIVAALTPPDWEVKIVDEEHEKVNLEEEADLVGFSLMTPNAPRGYELADWFKKRGIPTVAGGIHPSLLPEEALAHFHTVVIGEAEKVWGKLIQDLKQGRLQRIYKSPYMVDMNDYVTPFRKLLKTTFSFNTAPIEATRGCPFSCEFCTIHRFFGKRYRRRKVKEVIEECCKLKMQGYKILCFIDDNIMSDPEWAKDFFKALRPFGLKWGGQATLTAASDPEMIRLAAKSGCISLFIGIESVNQEALKSVRKGFNEIKRYKEYVDIFHDNGIVIIGGIIFGFDEDDQFVFERTVEVLHKLKIGLPSFSILIPLPGTKIRERLLKENRILTNDWSRYHGGEVVFIPKQMSPEELQAGANWAGRQFYKLDKIFSRLSKNWQHPIYYTALAFTYWQKHKRHEPGYIQPLPKDQLEVYLSDIF